MLPKLGDWAWNNGEGGGAVGAKPASSPHGLWVVNVKHHGWQVVFWKGLWCKGRIVHLALVPLVELVHFTPHLGLCLHQSNYGVQSMGWQCWKLPFWHQRFSFSVFSDLIATTFTLKLNVSSLSFSLITEIALNFILDLYLVPQLIISLNSSLTLYYQIY